MIYCPNCKNLLDEVSLSCGGEECLPPKFGVARLLKKQFAERFLPHEERFIQIREQEGTRWKDASLYEKMPYLNKEEGKGYPEWKGFQADLKIIDKYLKNKNGLDVLNYGSWNGWLSNQLVMRGHQVTAIGYFADEFDGLGAQQFYQNNWLSIQMDIENGLDLLARTYDCIIMNRGISFLEDPEKTCRELISKLNNNGLLVITGMNVYANPAKAIKSKEAYWEHFKKTYGFDLRFTNSKSHLSADDHLRFRELGIETFPYPDKILQNMRAGIIRTKPLYLYGVYQKN